MTTDKQIEAVARAIYTADNNNCYEWRELCTSTQERFLSEAKAAIDASGAEHIPMLAEALRMARNRIEYLAVVSYDLRHSAANERDYFPMIDKVLNKLPEELRGWLNIKKEKAK